MPHRTLLDIHKQTSASVIVALNTQNSSLWCHLQNRAVQYSHTTPSVKARLCEFALLNYWPSLVRTPMRAEHRQLTRSSPPAVEQLALCQRQTTTTTTRRRTCRRRGFKRYRMTYLSLPRGFCHRRQPLRRSPTWLEPVHRGPALGCMWRSRR